MKIKSEKISFLDRSEKNNVNYFLNNSYHLFDYKFARYQFLDDLEFFGKITRSIKKKIEYYQQQIDISLRTVFVCSLDRNSELIKIDNEYILVLDLHQIFEYIEAIYLTQIINANSVNAYITMRRTMKEILQSENIKTDIQEKFINNVLNEKAEALINSDVCAPVFLNNLADILFNDGYVDASIVCLNSILSIEKIIFSNKFNESLLSNGEVLKSILCDIISSFIVSHEINHLIVKNDRIKLVESSFTEVLLTIDIISRYAQFTEIWKEYSTHIKRIIDTRRVELYRIIKSSNVDSDLQKTLEKELNKLFYVWMSMSFEEYSPHDYEELFCDIQAIKVIVSTEDDVNDITFDIANIIYMLMTQETYNAQRDIVNILLRKTNTMSVINIKRIQFIICNLIFAKIYKHLPTNFQSFCILKELELSDVQFDDLIEGIMEHLSVMFNAYYITAIYNSISLFKNDFFHKEINAVFFRDAKKKTFVFTDKVDNIQIESDCRISPIDFIIMQDNFIDAYLKYRRYVYENNID